MRIPARHLQAIITSATGSSDEVCGILLGRRTPEFVVDQLVPAWNLHPTPRSNFLLDAASLLQADQEARMMGREIIGFFHSHPDGVAIPSMHDRRDAWPEHVYIISAPGASRFVYLCAWIIKRGGKIQPEPILPEDPCSKNNVM
jgi:proteasome lid subunit RPN8/RPN11